MKLFGKQTFCFPCPGSQGESRKSGQLLNFKWGSCYQRQMAGQVNNHHNNWCKGARHRVSPWGLFPVPGTKDKWIVWNVQPPYLSTSYKIWARRAVRDKSLWALEVYILDFSQVAQMVKHLPAMRETWFWFPGWEYTLGKEMATHSSTLAWKIQWTDEPGRLQSMVSRRVGHDWATSLSFFLWTT